MANFNGKYKLTDKDADNFEKYMTALGCNFMTKKAAKHMNQDVTMD